ncbi:MAG TPA: hypothetical protein VEH84_03280 [Alphaproteobacteria bacterium]|nr:hypothetical protein [Alphaproteobacteria bacterium]
MATITQPHPAAARLAVAGAYRRPLARLVVRLAIALAERLDRRMRPLRPADLSPHLRRDLGL